MSRARREKRSPLGALAAFVVGSTLSGAALGAVVGALGMALLARLGHPVRPWLPGGALAALFALHEYGLVALPLPQFRRQVDEGWRRRLTPELASLVYGLGLGHGLATRIPFTAYYLALLGAFTLADPVAAAACFAAYGLARSAVVVAVSAGAATDEEPGVSGVLRLDRAGALVRALNGVGMLVTASFCLWRGLAR